MRWDGLFDDLEARAAALAREQRAAEIEERVRGEVGALRMHDRLHPSLGHVIRLAVAGGLAVTGRLARCGPDWLLIEDAGGQETVVAAGNVLTVRGLGRLAAVPGTEGLVASRLGLRQVLRGLARDRSAVAVRLTDGATVDGTLDRVGADYVEVAVHPAGELRRPGEVRDVAVLPLPAVAAVRRAR